MYHNNYTFGLYNDGMPLGFDAALASNMAARERFSNLSDRERAELIARAHGLGGADELRAFIDKFGAGALE